MTVIDEDILVDLWWRWCRREWYMIGWRVMMDKLMDVPRPEWAVVE